MRKEWKQSTLTGRLTTRPITICGRTGLRTSEAWAYIELDSGESRNITIKADEPFFMAFCECRKGQKLSVSGLCNGRSVKEVNALSGGSLMECASWRECANG